MKPRDIFLSWDLWVSLLAGAAVWLCFPDPISGLFTKDIYGVAISCLSIIFSAYFAALAIIISASDDDFVRFLDETGDYSKMLNTFKYTLGALFISLLVSIGAYVYGAAHLSPDANYKQSLWWFVVFVVLSSYALIATLQTAMDAVTYAMTRREFLRITKK